jgi:hypothetical protein
LAAAWALSLGLTGCVLSLPPDPGDVQTDEEGSERTYSGAPSDPSSSSSTQQQGGECDQAEDCDPIWYCYCEEGPPVNSRTCDNGYCLHAEEICADSCAAFGTVWTGYFGSSADASDSGSSSSRPSCDGFYASNTCGTCGELECCAEAGACLDNADCREIVDCVATCQYQGASESYCEGYCEDYFYNGASTYRAWADCMRLRCYDECY